MRLSFFSIAMVMYTWHYTWAREKVTSHRGDTKTQGASPPNFLIMVADDLGIGDIGCFGNDTIRTPYIDAIGRKGVKLTHHLAGAPSCTPSRGAFLTGRLPIRLGLCGPTPVNVLPFLASTGGLPANETTFAKVLQQHGYSTAIIGKWHLGLDCVSKGDMCHHPNSHGFDYFFGSPLGNLKDFGSDGENLLWAVRPELWRIIVGSATVGLVSLLFLRRFIGKWPAVTLGTLAILFSALNYLFWSNFGRVNSALLRNAELVEQPINFANMTERLVKEGVQFLEQRSQDQKPFLLFMSWLQVHTFLHASPAFQGKSRHGPYGDEIEEMDWSVGEMTQALDRLGLTTNTLVYFTSDNGGHLEESDVLGRRAGGHNGIYRGGKVQGGQDGGVRAPTVVMLPGVIPPGSTVDEPTSQMDLYPTISALVGEPLPSDRVIDGHDIMPLLRGQTSRSPHRFLFHYCSQWLHAIRYRPDKGSAIYKLFYYFPMWKPGQEGCDFACSCRDHHFKLESPRFFNIAVDPSERQPLDITHPDNVQVIALIEQARLEHEAGVDMVEQQFTPSKLIWRPWLQPCCNFPTCTCSDLNNSLLSKHN